eukprot:CAMPEP_0194305374 /NCGR_PEP_ID=MMETSP0171-20130528/2826_1 /TAXON_ID=218684 /ORGANISM="Corethron pennatum, Strain L29A3" /LENGTH=430 /DNA_ID=CAMNT_0039056887 /DNA_START=32 /DNA_END=1322 /DNA_ORIENTATION=+
MLQYVENLKEAYLSPGSIWNGNFSFGGPFHLLFDISAADGTVPDLFAYGTGIPQQADTLFWAALVGGRDEGPRLVRVTVVVRAEETGLGVWQSDAGVDMVQQLRRPRRPPRGDGGGIQAGRHLSVLEERGIVPGQQAAPCPVLIGLGPGFPQGVQRFEGDAAAPDRHLAEERGHVIVEVRRLRPAPRPGREDTLVVVDEDHVHRRQKLEVRRIGQVAPAELDPPLQVLTVHGIVDAADGRPQPPPELLRDPHASRHQLQAARTAAPGGGRLDRHQADAAADVEEGVVRCQPDQVEDLLGGRRQEPAVLCAVLLLGRDERGHPVPHLHRARGVDVADGLVPTFQSQVGDHQAEVGKESRAPSLGLLGAGRTAPPDALLLFSLLLPTTTTASSVLFFFFFGGQSVGAEGGRDTWWTQHKNRNRDVSAKRRSM